MMRHALLAAALLLATLARPQFIPVITEQEPSPDGTSTLHLQGFFREADSVYVQVYHDSDVITEEVRFYTWALTLGTYPWYCIKFTDARGRVKYLWVLELSSAHIEFVPPIEIDFGRNGDLLLVKQSDGKPDFLMIDVGLGRKRP